MSNTFVLLAPLVTTPEGSKHFTRPPGNIERVLHPLVSGTSSTLTTGSTVRTYPSEGLRMAETLWMNDLSGDQGRLLRQSL
ncbi:hypothetical protein N7540_008185 [Penicillium herquei]|nr:hypothetical protein N7540_008185 [Penicillium herquei]